MDIRVFSRRSIESGVLVQLQEKDPKVRLACISITDTGSSPAQIVAHRGGSVRILRLRFDDVDPVLELKSCCFYTAMTPQQAKSVVTFLNTIRGQVDVLAIHCEAGISRSAGVAAACAEILGQDSSMFFLDPYSPNHFCYELTLQVADRKEVKMALVPKNMTADQLEVRHADLQGVPDLSYYRSQCPVCPDGLLLMRRDPETLELQEHDRCTSCGQLVRYLDIVDMRKRELGKTGVKPRS